MMGIGKLLKYLILLTILLSGRLAVGQSTDTTLSVTIGNLDEVADTTLVLEQPAKKQIPHAADITTLLDTTQISFVQPNQELLKKFKEDPQYNYYEHKVKDERTLWDYIKAWLFRWLLENVNPDLNEKKYDNTVLVIGLILVVALLIIIIIKKPSIFFRNKKRKQEYQVEEETIYGMNFDKLITAALQEKDYTQAIRWKYLQTLKNLQDKELINWNPNKTVFEYAYELKSPTLRNLFRELSTFFLYFRYGNFEAVEEHFNEVKKLSDEINQMLGT